MITETWNLDKEINGETHWACGRAMAKWKGSYPVGFLQRLDKRIGLTGKKVLTLFCGILTWATLVPNSLARRVA